MKHLAILGSTGSIGTNTLDVVRKNPDLFQVEALSTYSKIDDLLKQIEEFKPKKAVVCQIDKYKELRNKMNSSQTELLYGEEGLLEIVSDNPTNCIVNALVGFSGLKPTIEAIKNKKEIAIANKETIVVGGELVFNLAKKYNVSIIPIDSEHSALLFLLRNNNRKEVNKLILTASGGPFRDMKKEDLEHVTLKQALNHPTWSMGQKITIDSSTLMNKGFEVIEAHYLFDFDFDDIEVIIHKESIIHSMIETVDGEIYAQLGPNDMRFPIQNALTYPNVLSNNFQRLNLWEVGTLSFSKPDFTKFPLLKIAYEVGDKKGTLPSVLNASNEEAVYAFLDKKINYKDIVKMVEKSICKHENNKQPELEDIFQADEWARSYTKEQIKNMN